MFAFAALLLVWPVAISQANAEEIDASMSSTCGFTLGNIGTGVNFGAFDSGDDAAAVGEVEVELDFVADSFGSARVFVTVADWKTVGTRATGTIELTGATDTSSDSVTIGGETYDAHATTTAANQFDISGSDVDDAVELAAAVRLTDAANFAVSTVGTNVVTVETIARGTAQNTGTVLSEDTTGARIVTKDSTGTTTSNDMDGAVDTALTIMNGDTTKFDMNVGSSITDTYANKRSVVAVDASQAVLGGTDPTKNIFFALMIDPASATFTASSLPYDGAITQEITVTVEAACDGTAP